MSGLSRDDIDEILALLDHSNFDELKLELGDTRIELRRRGATPAPPAATPPVTTPVVTTPVVTAAPDRSHRDPNVPHHGGIDVPAPQLGIFYHSPRPGEPPFVSVGDEVHPDTVIGIIEVMKLMNTVTAGVTGTVSEVVAPNGEPVKQGDTLIRVRPNY